MVPSFVHTTIASNNPMICVQWINPYTMIVNVFAFFSCCFYSFSTVLSVVQPSVHKKDLIFIVGITNYFLIVIPTSAIRINFFPTPPFVGRFVQPLLVFFCFNQCINEIGICSRNVHSNSAFNRRG